jgi:hypothetical protein
VKGAVEVRQIPETGTEGDFADATVCFQELAADIAKAEIGDIGLECLADLAPEEPAEGRRSEATWTICSTT